MEPADIQQMTRAERLRAMELLWDALVQDADSVPSPAWHAQVLEERMEKIRRGEGRFLSLDEVKRRLRP